jgi:hypothetical protein
MTGEDGGGSRFVGERVAGAFSARRRAASRGHGNSVKDGRLRTGDSRGRAQQGRAGRRDWTTRKVRGRLRCAGEGLIAARRRAATRDGAQKSAPMKACKLRVKTQRRRERYDRGRGGAVTRQVDVGARDGG